MHTSISTIIWILALLRPVAISVAIENQEPLQQIKKPTDPSSFHDCRQNVPGDSPAHYNGDPKDDILTIEKLDLIPNPPDDHFTLTLTGTLTSALGPTPLIKVTASLNGTLGPSVKDKICNHRLEITQNEAYKCPPEKGPVEMSYSVMIPYPWLKKGYYTVRTEMFTTKGERMTDFEGTVWVDGEVGGDDGWV